MKGSFYTEYFYRFSFYFLGYAALIVAFASAVILAIIAIAIFRYLRGKLKETNANNATYSKVNTEETFRDDKHEKTALTPFKSSLKSGVQRSVSWDSALDVADNESFNQTVTLVKEAYAETCVSDYDLEKESLSAYGDLPNWQQSSLRADILATQSTSARIQISLIYNFEKKYIAGKITRINDVPSPLDGGPHQVKVHLVLLPMKKYVLKTKFHNINVNAKLDDYFKMKFKSPPDPNTTALRYRIYGRRLKFAVPGREKCLGEVCVDLAEVAMSKGGVTLWKNILPRGISRAAEFQR